MKIRYSVLVLCLMVGGCSLHRNEWGQVDIQGVCDGPRHVTREEFIKDGVPSAVAFDEWYWNRKDNNLTCAEMHQVRGDGDLKDFYAVEIVGTKEIALFSDFSDAVHWINSRAFFQNPKQVR